MKIQERKALSEGRRDQSEREKRNKTEERKTERNMGVKEELRKLNKRPTRSEHSDTANKIDIFFLKISMVFFMAWGVSYS